MIFGIILMKKLSEEEIREKIRKVKENIWIVNILMSYISYKGVKASC